MSVRKRYSENFLKQAFFYLNYFVEIKNASFRILVCYDPFIERRYKFNKLKEYYIYQFYRIYINL